MARPFDVILVGWHIPLVVCGAGVLAVVVTGAVRGLNTRTGRLITALVIWMCLVSPFSIWKGGSAQYLKSYVLLLVVLFLAIAESPKTFAGVKRLMQVLGVTVSLAAVVFAALGKGHSTGKAAAESYRSGGVGMFGNEGEFALLIGFVLPFWIFYSSSIRNKVLRLVLMSGGSLYLIWLLVMTGTRSALVALVPVGLLLLVRLPMIQRVLLVVTAVLVCVGIVAAAPQKVLERLATFSAPDSADHVRDPGDVAEAAASEEERKQLVWDGLQIIARNPVFGVGPGNFADYRYNVLHKRSWFPAHNTYVQVAAENGVIGGILYIIIVLSVFATIRVVRKRCVRGDPEWDLVSRMTLCLQASLVFYAVMAAFQNCDRYPHLFIIAGLAAALERLTNSRLAGTELRQSPARPNAAFNPIRGLPAARLTGPGFSGRC